jgi:hypothetical protein
MFQEESSRSQACLPLFGSQPSGLDRQFTPSVRQMVGGNEWGCSACNLPLVAQDWMYDSDLKWEHFNGKGNPMKVDCPQCLGRIPVSRDVFRKGYKCIRCGTDVVASATYARVLSLLSMLLSIGFLWAIHARILYFLILVIPIWLLILSVMVRVVPHFVAPHLDLVNSSTVTKLGISDHP